MLAKWVSLPLICLQLKRQNPILKFGEFQTPRRNIELQLLGAKSGKCPVRSKLLRSCFQLFYILCSCDSLMTCLCFGSHHSPPHLWTPVPKVPHLHLIVSPSVLCIYSSCLFLARFWCVLHFGSYYPSRALHHFNSNWFLTLPSPLYHCCLVNPLMLCSWLYQDKVLTLPQSLIPP